MGEKDKLLNSRESVLDSENLRSENVSFGDMVGSSCANDGHLDSAIGTDRFSDIELSEVSNSNKKASKLPISDRLESIFKEYCKMIRDSLEWKMTFVKYSNLKSDHGDAVLPDIQPSLSRVL